MIQLMKLKITQLNDSMRYASRYYAYDLISNSIDGQVRHCVKYFIWDAAAESICNSIYDSLWYSVWIDGVLFNEA